MCRETSRLFAIVPAAGLSRRMGSPKLTLPLGHSTVIERMLSSLDHPSIVTTYVITRHGDSDLRRLITEQKAICVSPDVDPPDMRCSVEFGLTQIRQRYNPGDHDGWILCPADHPVLDARIVNELIIKWDQTDSNILVPKYGLRRGHPTFFRWTLEREVQAIPKDRGLNWLLQAHATEIEEFVTDNQAILTDLDTPEDYERLQREINQ